MITSLESDPIALFAQWLAEAQKSEPNDPEAVCLATCDNKGTPSARMILMKGYDERGFKFHTSSTSHKGQDLEQNPRGEMCFYWKSTRKQIRIAGEIEQIAAQESDEYFKTRPLARKIGAWASDQSKPLSNPTELEQRVKEYEKKFMNTAENDIPRPDYWNGYRLIPTSMEFWIGNQNRLHDRFVYKRADTNAQWVTRHLNP